MVNFNLGTEEKCQQHSLSLERATNKRNAPRPETKEICLTKARNFKATMYSLYFQCFKSITLYMSHWFSKLFFFGMYFQKS